jgi:fatty acid desaturase
MDLSPFMIAIFDDVQIVLKIFLFMMLYNFGRNHLGNSPLAVIVILVFGFFMLFVFWPLFGTLYLLYILFMLGISQVIIDYIFVMPQVDESPMSSGADMAARMRASGKTRQSLAGKMIHPPKGGGG